MVRPPAPRPNLADPAVRASLPPEQLRRRLRNSPKAGPPPKIDRLPFEAILQSFDAALREAIYVVGKYLSQAIAPSHRRVAHSASRSSTCGDDGDGPPADRHVYHGGAR
jgi:hypothetical protein